MSFIIVTDSASDLLSFESSVKFASVPLTINAGEKEFVDENGLDIKEMVEYLSGYKGKSGTACPGVAAWIDAFDGADEVICFTITSGLSGSYNSAMTAKDEYESENPNKKVYIVDSLSTGPEMKLLIEKAIELREAGETFGNICEKLEQYKRTTALLFSLESLNNLANNGRVSPVVAKFAGILGMRIVGKASDKGQLETLDKCRGAKKTVAKLFSRLKEMGYKGGKIRIDHCFNEECAHDFEKLVISEFKDANIIIGETLGLCSFYAEQGGLLIGFEV